MEEFDKWFENIHAGGYKWIKDKKNNEQVLKVDIIPHIAEEAWLASKQSDIEKLKKMREELTTRLKASGNLPIRHRFAERIYELDQAIAKLKEE